MKREIKFRFWDKFLKKMIYRNLEKYDTEHPDIVVMQYTGFKSNNGREIYEGDILSEFLDGQKEINVPNRQVYWCEKLGCWKLDNSFKQDASSGYLLANELNDFKFFVTGNIYDNK